MNNLSELSGPASVLVQTDIGQPGIRGNIIHLSDGDPNTPGNLEQDPIQYDLAINIDTQDTGYLFLYYYDEVVVSHGPPEVKALAWVPKFRLVPNSLSKNENVTFVNGQATASITAPVPPNVSIDTNSPEDSIDLQYNIVNRIDLSTSVQNPISSFFYIDSLTVNNGFATIQFVFNAIELNSGSWVPVVGEKTMHLVITVV